MVLSFSTSPPPITRNNDSTSTPPHILQYPGPNLIKWIEQAECFFQFYGICETERFLYVIEAFDDEPFYWFNSWFRSDNLTWNDFTLALFTRFIDGASEEHSEQRPHAYADKKLDGVISLKLDASKIASVNNLTVVSSKLNTFQQVGVDATKDMVAVVSSKLNTFRQMGVAATKDISPFDSFHAKPMSREYVRDYIFTQPSTGGNSHPQIVPEKILHHQFHSDFYLIKWHLEWQKGYSMLCLVVTKLHVTRRCEWRPPWQVSCAIVMSKQNATGRHDWSPP